MKNRGVLVVPASAGRASPLGASERRGCASLEHQTEQMVIPHDLSGDAGAAVLAKGEGMVEPQQRVSAPRFRSGDVAASAPHSGRQAHKRRERLVDASLVVHELPVHDEGAAAERGQITAVASPNQDNLSRLLPLTDHAC